MALVGFDEAMNLFFGSVKGAAFVRANHPNGVYTQSVFSHPFNPNNDNQALYMLMSNGYSGNE